MKENLYEIAQGIAKIEDYIEDEKLLAEYLESANMQLKEKVDATVRVIRMFESSAEAIDTEIKRLNELKKSRLSNAERIEKWISYSMTNNGIEKIDTDLFKLSFRKSKATIIDNEKELDKKFIDVKITAKPNLTSIKKAIENGEEVSGAHLEERKNLQIK